MSSVLLKKKCRLTKSERNKRRVKSCENKDPEAKPNGKKDLVKHVRKASHYSTQSNPSLPNVRSSMTNKRLTMKVGLYKLGKKSSTVTRAVSEESRARAEEDLKRLLDLANSPRPKLISLEDVKERYKASDAPSLVAFSYQSSPASKRSKKSPTPRSLRSCSPVPVLDETTESPLGTAKAVDPDHETIAEMIDSAANHKIKEMFVGRSLMTELKAELRKLCHESETEERLFKIPPMEASSPEDDDDDDDDDEETFQLLEIPGAGTDVEVSSNPMDGLAFLRLAEADQKAKDVPTLADTAPVSEGQDLQAGYVDAPNVSAQPMVYIPVQPPGHQLFHTYPCPILKPAYPQMLYPQPPWSGKGPIPTSDCVNKKVSVVTDHDDYCIPSDNIQYFVVSPGIGKQLVLSQSQTHLNQSHPPECPPRTLCDFPADPVSKYRFTVDDFVKTNMPCCSKSHVDILDYLERTSRNYNHSNQSSTVIASSSPDSDGAPTWRPLYGSPLRPPHLDSPSPPHQFFPHKLY